MVLLYDSSDSLPLPVHLYASMLAHLHASLNFIIYGLMNRNLRSGFVAHLVACCQVSPDNGPAAAAIVGSRSCNLQHTSGREGGGNSGIRMSRSLASVEYCQLQEVIGAGAETNDAVGHQQFLTVQRIN